MYRLAYEKISEGLSPVARFILGFFSGIMGVVMILIGMMPNSHWGIFLVGGFCIAITLACIFKGAIRRFLGSVVGTSIFVMGIWYFYSEINAGKIVSDSRSEPSILNAIAFLVFMGIPGIVYAIKVRFGFKKMNDDQYATRNGK